MTAGESPASLWNRRYQDAEQLWPVDVVAIAQRPA